MDPFHGIRDSVVLCPFKANCKTFSITNPLRMRKNLNEEGRRRSRTKKEDSWICFLKLGRRWSLRGVRDSGSGDSVLNTLKGIERANTRARKAEGDVEVKIRRKRSCGSLR